MPRMNDEIAKDLLIEIRQLKEAVQMLTDVVRDK